MTFIEKENHIEATFSYKKVKYTLNITYDGKLLSSQSANSMCFFSFENENIYLKEIKNLHGNISLSAINDALLPASSTRCYLGVEQLSKIDYQLVE